MGQVDRTGFGVTTALLLLLALSATAATRTQAAEAVYAFGVVPQFTPRQTRDIWHPILERIGKRTGLHFRLTGSPDIPTFERQFLKGEFDFAYMNPYHLLKGSRSQGYEPLVRDTGRMLHGILLVRKNSPIRDVKALQGKRVDFPSPNALGASLLLRAALLDRFAVAVEPHYVQNHSSVYLNVVLGQAEAGGGVQKSLEQQPAKIRDALRVLYRTSGVPSHPIVAHPRVNQRHRKQVREAFLELGTDAGGRQLLSRIPIAAIGTASMEDYLPLERLGLDRFYREE